MSDMFETIEDVSHKPKHRGGIKSFTFTASGTNGTSHRAHAAQKHRRYLENRRIRSQLYSQMRGERGWLRSSPECREWHQRLDSLSNGVS
jgi:hypothetical protein